MARGPGRWHAVFETIAAAFRERRTHSMAFRDQFWVRIGNSNPLPFQLSPRSLGSVLPKELTHGKLLTALEHISTHIQIFLEMRILLIS